HPVEATTLEPRVTRRGHEYADLPTAFRHARPNKNLGELIEVRPRQVYGKFDRRGGGGGGPLPPPSAPPPLPPPNCPVGGGAEGRRADLGRVFLEQAGEWPRSRARLPGRAPAREFGVVDQQIDATGARVDADAVAVADERDRSARHRLGRDVTDAHAAGGAG